MSARFSPSRVIACAVPVVAVLSLAACEAPSAQDETTAAPSEPSAATQAAPLTPSGAPAALTVEQGPDGDDLQTAASVVRVDAIPGESAKLFGASGGDPAMNGLHTHIAFFHSPAEGWAVYRIGDFLDYRVLSNANGRVDLEIEESAADPATGDIGSRKRRLIVQWTQGADDEVPTAVTVTPAA